MRPPRDRQSSFLANRSPPPILQRTNPESAFLGPIVELLYASVDLVKEDTCVDKTRGQGIEQIAGRDGRSEILIRDVME